MCWQELLEKVTNISLNHPTSPSAPKITIRPSSAPLKKTDYLSVKYWLKNEYKAAVADLKGDTDVLNGKHKWGHPTKEEGPALRHYLKDEDGNSMSADCLTLAGDKFKALANTLLNAGITPPSWKKQTNDAYNFMHCEMKAEFVEFALCEGDWKGEMYFTMEYPCWAHHKPGLCDSETTDTKKHKRSNSMFSGMMKMEDVDIPSTPVMVWSILE